MFLTTTGNQKSKSKSAAKFKKRAGAKAVKTFERNAAGADVMLNRQAATTYRAVSARANYLAADRADGSYSSKELCRDSANPTTTLWGNSSAWCATMSEDRDWYIAMTSPISLSLSLTPTVTRMLQVVK